MGDFFTFVSDWLNSGIYTFATDFGAWFVEYAVMSYLTFMNFAIPFAWGIAKTILQDLNISAQINAAYDSLPSMTQDILTALRIPECLNFIFSALGTRFVLRFIPGV